MKWEADIHGCLNLNLPEALGGGFVFIKPRQPYCDRGHWDWGIQGIGMSATTPRTPSYYFMTLDNAIQEIEAWLIRKYNEDTFNSPDFPNSGLDTRSPRITAGRGNALISGNLLMDRDGRPTWELKVDGIDNIDSADCFPRHYSAAPVAMDEANRFLKWRLAQKPSVIPARLTSADERPVCAELRSLSGLPALLPKTRRRSSPKNP